MAYRPYWTTIATAALNAGDALRFPVEFDRERRNREVAEQVARAKRIALWPLPAALLALLLPAGALWAGLVIAVWIGSIWFRTRRSPLLQERLDAETAALEQQYRDRATALAGTIAAADGGNEAAARRLLEQWTRLLPGELATARLTVRRSGSGWTVEGTGVARESIPTRVPRIGARGRTVHDRRKASDVDEDLVELNAALVVSCLLALTAGPTTQQFTIAVAVAHPASLTLVQWVTLGAAVDSRGLRAVVEAASRPSAMIRKLGGDLGQCRSQRVLPARAPTMPPDKPNEADVRNPPRSNGGVPRFAELLVTAASPSASATGGSAVPPPPLAPRPTAADVTVTVRQVNGSFAQIARRFAEYDGPEKAEFVPFQSYWPQYSSMSQPQLSFYFWWRRAVRQGEAPQTDMSYIFVHVYELLHVIGATDARNAAQQLEELWHAYRLQYPRLDFYLTTWITDLYAVEVDTASAMEFIFRSAGIGASLDPDARMLVTDRYWSSSDYGDMPRFSLATLSGDPRLGENKFCRQFNEGTEHAGWVDHAYREALAVADTAFLSGTKATPRAAELARWGEVEIERESFRSAVYEWRRKPVRLGKVPRLTEDGIAIPLYRNAVRYAENLLRKQRGFTGRLRGVSVDKALAAALEAHFASYVRVTRPRARVTIDLARAEELSRESADVRSRLLEGVEAAGQAAPNPEIAQYVAAGLLTDLDAVQAALSGISRDTQAVFDALIDGGWELPTDADALKAAAGTALIAPLVDEINRRSADALGQPLIARESDMFVVQEDFRDEVYWVLRGSLDGFASHPGRPTATSAGVTTADQPPAPIVFPPLERKALAIVADGGSDVPGALTALARSNSTTTLLLVDRINEYAVASEYGDLVIDTTADPPEILADAATFVADALAEAPAVTV